MTWIEWDMRSIGVRALGLTPCQGRFQGLGQRWHARLPDNVDVEHVLLPPPDYNLLQGAAA